ncbi:carbohydrate-binding module family 20 domain-containing protein [Marinitenerispora sediminis]|uniref:Alpha-amylase n=1 Tax=Marinitenerispora sediminis TaxID=1931232 RepID=A0A368T953_9ACTN|nr:carbohydrate-binding module family 20 domain-containing protein [Marinitenerispora sediminis]RCV47740.1 alpha-amlyase [Marinitenerispora sediminis]RCV48259.1 alpha-amlyase [Marinitenerispora sediminis]RCV60952.1 alpha-amlyase [Marinitenerispora sediminis]
MQLRPWARAAVAAVLGAVLGLTPLNLRETPAYAAEDSAPAAAAAEANGDVIVHLFEWPWDSVAAECETFLGPNGYGAVQVSPPQEHVVLRDQGFPWWQDYQPVSYQIESRRGDRAQFAAMVATCRDAGVKIYVDAVLNHMTGSGSVNSGPGSAGSTFTKYEYPGIYGDQDFHGCRRDIANWNDANEIRTCELVALSDLRTGSDYVRGRLAAYLNDLVSLGVAGFRIDAAKHMAVADIADIRGRLDDVPHWGGRPYLYQEVIEDSAISPTEYVGQGDVTDFRYHRQVSQAFRNGSLGGLRDLPGAMAVRGDQAVVFIDNHDTQRSDPTLTYKNGAAYDVAEAFMLAYPFGTPKVMSSFAFSDNDAGPPADGDGMTSPADCSASAWVCEHRHQPIAGLVGFRNAVGEAGVTDWWDGGAGQIAFGRGDRGYAVFNRGSAIGTRTFQTSLPAGTYCDVASGPATDTGCAGDSYTVAADGTFRAAVPADSVLALHVAAPGDGSGPPPTDPDGCTTVATAFHARTTTWFGQNVFVVGSLPELGGWDPARAVPLSSTDYPVWKASVDLPADTAFEYKYVKKNPDGTVEWESDPDRAGRTGDPEGCELTLTDTWR